MSKTAAEMLSAVQDAIYAILTGSVVKSYSIGGKEIEKYSIKELRELEKEYQAKVAAETSGGTKNFARFDTT